MNNSTTGFGRNCGLKDEMSKGAKELDLTFIDTNIKDI